MSDHGHRTIERHCDVAVVGGSAAGLAAALQLGRQRRSVIVVDAGEPRNAPAAHVHGYLGHEGIPPSQLLERAREEVRSYGVEVLAGRAVDVARIDERHLRVALAGGHAVVARRVLAATGLVDEPPDIDGVAEHWGRGVIHCPFCHGYEVRDRRVVQIVTHPMGLHQAALFRQLTQRLTIVLHEGVAADAPAVAALRVAGVAVVEAPVTRLVTDVRGDLAGVELAGGERIGADAVVVGPRVRARAEAFASLGLRTVPHPSGLGDHVPTGADGETAVPRLHAAGNVTEPSQQVLHAAASGSRAGGAICVALAHEDVELLERPSGNEADWDHRYGGERVWSGNPNGTLVHEVERLAPGRALDVGTGEGGDAVWLGARGWRVTANDISRRALARVQAAAHERGIDLECLHADANDRHAFGAGAGTFDLVSAMYASIPRTPDARAIGNLLDAVAPGGTLLVVGHDLAPMRTPVDTREHSRAFDPDAYVRVDDVAAALAGRAEWSIEVHEQRPRPPGAASSHHVDDVVLRATRRSR